MGQNLMRNGQILFDLVEKNSRTIESASLTRTLLTNDEVRYSVKSNSRLDIKVNDYFEVFGDIFRINSLPRAKKINNSEFEYEIVAQGLMYDLQRCKFFNADATGFKPDYEFPLIGTIETFLLCVKNNMLRESDLWELGTFNNAETKTITFGNDTCLSALQKICQEFKTDFWVRFENGKYKIHTGEFGNTIPTTFEYGKGNGLYSIERNNVDENEIVNRLYVFGGSENIPSDYRNFSKRLLMAESDYLQDDVLVELQGLREGIIEFDDIYPKRTGKITALGDTKYKFIDETMDFDLNEKEADGVTTKYLIAGTSAKIHFNTGSLAGYEFEIKKGGYSHSTKTFEIIPFKNDQGQEFPDKENDVFQLSVDDEYVILDIVMPKTYIDNAEALLREKGIEQFELSKQAKVSYGLEIDPEFIKTLGLNTIEIGDYIHIVDEDLAINKVIRINSITRDFIQNGELFENDYKITIADEYEINYSSQAIIDIKDIKNVLNLTNLGHINLSMIGAKTTEELKNLAFDTDGYFNPENIRPFSIETSMLSIGSKSQQISCSCIFEINYQYNKNRVKVNAGQLFSQQVDKLWNIATAEFLISDDDWRYVYAKCSKSTNQASIVFTQDKIQPDSEPTDYYFLLGILHTVVEGIRVLSITTGTTTINGGLIRTGIISSLDGSTYFNLENNEIKGNITFNINSPAYQQILNHIQVGSRNLLMHSSFDETAGYYEFSPFGFNNATITNDSGTIKLVANETISNATAGLNVEVLNIDYSKLKNKVLTLSFKVKSLTNKVLAPVISSSTGFESVIYSESKSVGNNWQQLYVTFRTFDDNYTDFGFSCFCSDGFAIGETIWIDEPMLEWGNVVSDWSPSPEDIQENLDDANLVAQTALNNANVAQQSASAAISLLNDIASDNKVTASEKTPLKTEWGIIQNEKPVVIAQVNVYSLSTADFTNAYSELELYISSIGLFNDMTVTTDVNGNYLQYVFQNYYSKKVDLLKSVSDKAKQLADAAQNTANQAQYEAEIAQQGVLNMQTSIDDIEDKTDNFLSINGGLLMGNILSVGDNQLNQRAFLSGVTDSGDTTGTSVRFAAGANYANKDTAPFRVQDNGKLIATNAKINGEITATSGSFTGAINAITGTFGNTSGNQYFTISSNGIETYRGWVVAGDYTSGNNNRKYVSMQGSIGSGDPLIDIVNEKSDGFIHTGIKLDIRNGTGGNVALDIPNGGIRMGGNNGATMGVVVKNASGNNITLAFYNGIFIGVQ